MPIETSKSASKQYVLGKLVSGQVKLRGFFCAYFSVWFLAVIVTMVTATMEWWLIAITDSFVEVLLHNPETFASSQLYVYEIYTASNER